ncbi:hypothetical protein, partial [Micrococcus sp. KRD153]|uniref:hypothetical protein n=1 Tax=Micrococcus sp. KRD153 TaxID=2729724 RepID=UPI0019D08949
AERDALAADVEDLKHDIGQYVKISTEQATENVALAAELERLREDAERIDWLESKWTGGADVYPWPTNHFDLERRIRVSSKTIRTAIDQAREAK